MLKTNWLTQESTEGEKLCCFLAKLFLIAVVPFQNGASVGGCFGIITGYKPSLLVNGEFSCTYFSNKFLIFICTEFCSGCTHHVAHWEMMVWLHHPATTSLVKGKAGSVQTKPQNSRKWSLGTF